MGNSVYGSGGLTSRSLYGVGEDRGRSGRREEELYWNFQLERSSKYCGSYNRLKQLFKPFIGLFTISLGYAFDRNVDTKFDVLFVQINRYIINRR